MSSENISNWKYQNTQRSRDMLAEYLTGTKGIADAGAVAHLIADNERRGYLNHAAKIGATFGSVADVLAMQMDGNTPIEDDGRADAIRDAARIIAVAMADYGNAATIDDAFISEEGDVRYNITHSIAISGRRVADAIREHAAAIDRLASVIEKATDRPIRVETQY